MWIYVGPRLWSSGKSVVHAVRVRHMSWFQTFAADKSLVFKWRKGRGRRTDLLCTEFRTVCLKKTEICQSFWTDEKGKVPNRFKKDSI